MNPADRPDTQLLRVLKDIYQYPYPTFMGEGIHESVDATFNAYERLRLAAIDLNNAIPRSETWHVLARLFDDQSGNNLSENDSKRLRMLEKRLECLSQLPPLENALTKKGAPLKRPHLQVWVRAICWFVVNVEQKPLRFSVNDAGTPKGRLSDLLRITLQAMGMKPDDKALVTELRRVREGPNLKGIYFWDLIPLLPPRLES